MGITTRISTTSSPVPATVPLKYTPMETSKTAAGCTTITPTTMGSPQPRCMSFKPIDPAMSELSMPTTPMKRNHVSSLCGASSDNSGGSHDRLQKLQQQQQKRRRVTVSPSPSPDPQSRYCKKGGVRFASSIVSDVFTIDRFDFIPPIEMDEDGSTLLPPLPKERKDLWWTKDERYQIMQRNRLNAKEFELDHDDKVKYFLRVFDDLCLEEPPTTRSDEEEYYTDDQRHDDTPLAIPSKVRGLEYCVTPSIKSYRKLHVQHVLNVQYQLRRRLTVEFRTKVLSIRAIQSSHPSRILAQLIGEGDAQIAASFSHDSSKSPNTSSIVPTTLPSSSMRGRLSRKKRGGNVKMINDTKPRRGPRKMSTQPY